MINNIRYAGIKELQTAGSTIRFITMVGNLMLECCGVRGRREAVPGIPMHCTISFQQR